MTDYVRHIGVHRIISGEKVILRMAIVDITDGKVTGWHPMSNEEAATEWWGGTLELKEDGCCRIAYYQGKRIN